MSTQPRGNRLKPWIIAGLILLVAFLTVRWLVATKPEPPKVEQRKRATVVAVQEVQVRNLPPALKLYGKIESVSAAQLSSRIPASVQALHVEEGDRVKAGTLLVELEQNDARYALDQARARVTEAKSAVATEQSRYATDKAALANEQSLARIASDDLERFRQLQKEGLASQAQVDAARTALEQRLLAVSARELSVEQHESRMAQAEAQLASAQAAFNDVQLDLSRSRIEAPFDGLIHRVTIAVGDIVSPGTPLLGIYDPARIEVRAPVPSNALARIQAALAPDSSASAEIRVGGSTIPAHLRKLSASTREATGNLDVFIVPDKPSPLLRLGQTVTVLLKLDVENNVVAVPFSALYGSNRVYVLEDGTMRGIPVQRIGEMHHEDGSVQLLVRSEALQDGMQLITSQVAQALDGMSVTTAGSGKDTD